MENKKEKELTKKQDVFVSEYLANGGNKEQAYKSAFGNCGEKSLRSSVSRLLANPLVIEKIKDVKKNTVGDRVLDTNFFRKETLELYYTAKANDDITNARRLLDDLHKFKEKGGDETLEINIDFSCIIGGDKAVFDKNMGILNESEDIDYEDEE